MNTLSPISKQFAHLLNGEIEKDIDWQAMLFVAQKLGLLARVYYRLEEHDQLNQVPNRIMRHMMSSVRFAQAQRQQVLFECETLQQQLAKIDVQPVFLKGAAYVLADLPLSYGRFMSDLDILVKKEQLRDVENFLFVHGWVTQKPDEYDQYYYRRWAHEIPPLQHMDRQTVADVHHNILPPVSGRAPEMSLFKAFTQANEDGQHLFNPSALTLHSLVHLFFEDNFNKAFRDLNDLHQLFSHYGHLPEYWDQLRDLVQETGFGQEYYFALRYCQIFFSTTIPDLVRKSAIQYAPTPLKLKFFDWIFYRVLQPDHPIIKIRHLALAKLIAVVRSHMRKMPLRILVFHTFNKLSKWFTEELLGKQKSPNQQPQQAKMDG